MIKNKMIKTAAVCPDIKVGNPSYNADVILSVIKEMEDCSLIVFPECTLSGYTCGDMFFNDTLLDACEKALYKIAYESEKYPGLTVVIGLPIKVNNKLYNCAAVISAGGIAGIVPKINVPTYNEFYEGRWFASGKDVKQIDIACMNGRYTVPFGTDLLFYSTETGCMLGVEICEDLWVPDNPSTALCLAGADIIANLSASDETIGKQKFRRELVKEQSAACYCGYVYASAGTYESSTDLSYSGHLMIAECGHMLADEIYGVESVTALIDVDIIKNNRIKMTTFKNDTSCDYRICSISMSPVSGETDISASDMSKVLAKENYYISRLPFVPSSEEKKKERCQEILRIQSNALATRIKNTGIKNLIIGISGGLDSTLALIVCNEAKKLTPEIRITGITMPCNGQTSDRTYKNAWALLNALADVKREIPIDDTVAIHLKSIGHSKEYVGEEDTAYENAQARARTYILMDTANMESGMVIGTGDLSELALGWCTYNGDHMSMYAVNAGVPKTLVQFLIKTYADSLENSALKNTLYDIINTPISPELTPSGKDKIEQRTEEKIGKYDLNDFFLYYTLRHGMDAEKIYAFAMTAYPEQSSDDIKNAEIRFYKRFFSQQFKRSCLPDGPKVGSVSLSPRGDFRMPSDMKSDEIIKCIENA